MLSRHATYKYLFSSFSILSAMGGTIAPAASAMLSPTITLYMITVGAPVDGATDGSTSVEKEIKTEELIRNRFIQDLNNNQIKITITPLFGGHYAVALSGELETQGKVNDAKATAKKTVAAINKDKPNTILDKDYKDADLKVAAPKEPQKKTAGDIAKELRNYLVDDLLTIRVEPYVSRATPVSEDHYKVALIGVLPTQTRIDWAIQRTQDAITRVNADLARKVPSPRTAIETVIDVSELVIDPRDEIKRRFEQGLADKRLAVTVSPRIRKPQNQPSPPVYHVSIAGVVDNRAQRQSVRDAAEVVKAGLDTSPLVVRTSRPTWQVTGQDLVIDRTFLVDKDNDVTDVWPISYLGGAGTADISKAAVIDALVEALNASYGAKDAPVVTRDGNNLYLRGKSTTVLKIKSTLALIDTAQPQVQMDFWAIQISGNADEVDRRMEKIRGYIDQTRAGLTAFGPRLRQVLDRAQVDGVLDLNNELASNGSVLRSVYGRLFPLALARFDSMPWDDPSNRPFSAAFTPDEALILIGLSDNRRALIDRLQRHWVTSSDWLLSGDPSFNLKKTDLQTRYLRETDATKRANILGEMFALNEQVTKQPRPFYGLEQATQLANRAADQAGVREFLKAVDNYGALTRALGMVGEPQGSPLNGQAQIEDPADVLIGASHAAEGLGQHSAAVDTMLKNLVNAVQADLQAMYLTPLVERIRSVEKQSAAGGVTLIGKTHMVVSTRQQALLQPKMSSSVETTRPAPFGDDLLNLLAPEGAGGAKSERTTVTDSEGNSKTTSTATTSSDTTGLTGAAKLLAGLPPAQAALLAGALLNDVAPTFSTVAPGVTITIRPTMTPDGGAADLTLDSSFGVVTTALGSDKARTDVWAQAEPDGIQSHRVTTQAYVSGFDLFDVSSFNVQTSTPQAPDYVPILGRLPILGSAFQFPRGSKRVQHQSIILINAALLPRALGLTGFYGAARNSVPPPPPPGGGAAPTSEPIRPDRAGYYKFGQ